MNLFQLVDTAFDNLARKMAQNLCSNVETVARNRAVREMSNLAEQQCCERSANDERVQQGRQTKVRKSTDNDISPEDLEKLFYFLMTESEYQSKDKTLFTA